MNTNMIFNEKCFHCLVNEGFFKYFEMQVHFTDGIASGHELFLRKILEREIIVDLKLLCICNHADHVYA
jgi:hypothetical protein